MTCPSLVIKLLELIARLGACLGAKENVQVNVMVPANTESSTVPPGASRHTRFVEAVVEERWE